MMARRDCLVLGAGGHARAVVGLLHEERLQAAYRVIGLLDEAEPAEPEEVLGVPVLGRYDRLPGFFRDGVRAAVLAVGDNRKRRELYDHCRGMGLELPNVVSETAQIGEGTVMGDANVVLPRAFVGPLSQLGSNNVLNTGSILDHECRLGSHCHVGPAVAVAGRVCIGDDVFLGIGSRVVDKVAIAAGTILGAGGTVIDSITEEAGVWVGVPARRLRPR